MPAPSQTRAWLEVRELTVYAQFLAAEAMLSFLALGTGKAMPSWGNMLSAFQQLQVVSSYWWIAAPTVALVALSVTYLILADALHERSIAK